MGKQTEGKGASVTDRVQFLEESVAHLSRTLSELSDVVARQEDEIASLKRRQEMLMKQEAGRQASEGGSIHLGDQRPPHW